MTRKLVSTLVLAVLLVSSPAALAAHDGPLSAQGAVTADGGAGMHSLTAKHGAEADPDGVQEQGVANPLRSLVAWLQAFLSSALRI